MNISLFITKTYFVRVARWPGSIILSMFGFEMLLYLLKLRILRKHSLFVVITISRRSHSVISVNRFIIFYHVFISFNLKQMIAKFSSLSPKRAPVSAHSLCFDCVCNCNSRKVKFTKICFISLNLNVCRICCYYRVAIKYYFTEFIDTILDYVIKQYLSVICLQNSLFKLAHYLLLLIITMYVTTTLCYYLLRSESKFTNIPEIKIYCTRYLLLFYYSIRLNA